MGRYEVERNFLRSNFYKLKSIKTHKMKGLPQPEANHDIVTINVKNIVEVKYDDIR